jgi:UDP-N-acetylmuramyl pentapeptide synthase
LTHEVCKHQKILDFLHAHELAFFTVGPIFKNLNADGFESTAYLREKLGEQDLNACLILLKGSRGIALEQLIDCL